VCRAIAFARSRKCVDYSASGPHTFPDAHEVRVSFPYVKLTEW
jgi:hypothetical protein